MEYPPRKRVLLCEGDPEMRRIVEDLLVLLDCEWEVVQNRTPLLARLARTPAVDLLIFGARLAGPNGEEAASPVRKAGHRLPILVVGSFGSDVLRPEAWEDGKVLVRIAAPLAIDELIWAIRKALALD